MFLITERGVVASSACTAGLLAFALDASRAGENLVCASPVLVCHARRLG
jgi:hypothetical protein